VSVVCLDTSVLATWVLQERSWQVVDRLLGRADVETVLPGPVLTELVELVRRKGNQATGPEIRDTLVSIGARVEHPTDEDLLRAADLMEIAKAHPGARGETLSPGDALVLAITERLGVSVVTRDSYWHLFASDGHTAVNVVTL
jgi:predicted nucleic acid-binding protein